MPQEVLHDIIVPGVHAPDADEQVPQVHEDEHARVPDPQVPEQVSVVPCRHMNPLSIAPSQSSSRLLHVSVGGAQVPHVQEGVQVWRPVELHDVEQDRSIPGEQSPEGAEQEPQVHVDEHTRAPAPHVPEQVSRAPGRHMKPLSMVPSQSSSIPLQVSTGGVHVPQVQEVEQRRLPVDPQAVGQLSVRPEQQANPLSQAPSPSSSIPLQVSMGIVLEHELHVHPATQRRFPVRPSGVRQVSDAPRTQSYVSSLRLSQLSSIPLHTSGGGAHVFHAHDAEHDCRPVDPQRVGHIRSAPGIHSPVAPEHMPQVQVELQVRIPLPQAPGQGSVKPCRHMKPLSATPLQSSSRPLQVSIGGTHEFHRQAVEQLREPAEPQLVMQLSTIPAVHSPLGASHAPKRQFHPHR